MEQRAVGQFKVFLVEDSPMLRTRVEAMLGSISGATMVGHADGAQQAIAAILAARPHAVVLDLHLKEGNGFDVLRAVSKSAPDIAFYVLTNHPAEGYRLAAKRLGARGFFDKSTEVESLRQALVQASA